MLTPQQPVTSDAVAARVARRHVIAVCYDRPKPREVDEF